MRRRWALALVLLAGCGSSPAKVEHKYGTTTVPARPRRIVSVGLTEQDTILALGDSRPAVLHTDDGFEFEKIAALRPDLIVGVNSGMSKGDYEKLSRLAPTIPPGKGSTEYFSPWDTQVELIAAALGQAGGGRHLRRAPGRDRRGRDRVRHGEPSDVAAREKVPTFDKLAAVAEHRAVYTDGTLAGALYFISPLSLPYVLERLTPLLEAAVAGKAARKVVRSSW